MRIGATSGLTTLSYAGAADLIVLDDTGDPYLRIGPGGVFTNLNSSATYVNRSTTGDVEIPIRARQRGAVPAWERVSAGHSVEWHDHRAHWMGTAPSMTVVADPHSRHDVIPDWVIQ